MNKSTLLFVLGTRPEAVKTSPVICQCKETAAFNVRVLTTSQHRELQDTVLDFFGIVPDHDLNLMQRQSDLIRFVEKAWRGISDYLRFSPPDLLLVQGDTTTAFIAALASTYQQIPVAHIEAGLRTYDDQNPFPEEINRRLITHTAQLHFAPTQTSKDNLLRENVSSERIFVVGNPGIDALHSTLQRITPEFRKNMMNRYAILPKNILVTSHRRENWGQNLHSICEALRTLSKMFPDISILFLVHPNPEVRQCVHRELSGIDRVILLDAVSYPEMAVFMHSSFLVLTDSGGIQEEAPTLGKPVLVLREKTERPEGIDRRSSILVGTNSEKIIETVSELIHDRALYHQYSQCRSPYGDGQAAKRICEGIRYFFNNGNKPSEFLGARASLPAS